jgi:hypothetical protein
MRRLVIGGTAGGVLALIILVVDDLFIQFPMVMTTGDAHLQRWIGPDAARLSFLALALAIGGGYIWVALQGTREPAMRLSWLRGAVTGAGAGLVIALLYLAADGLATTGSGLQIPPVTLTLLLLLGPAVLGALAAAATARVAAGALAGFWFALSLALFAGVGLLVADSIFADRLAHTAWVGYHGNDPLCNDATGARLLGCAVGDDMGFAASAIVAFPLLGLGLGALAGLPGRALADRRQSPAAHWNASLRPPLVLSACLAAVLIAELAGNLW